MSSFAKKGFFSERKGKSSNHFARGFRRQSVKERHLRSSILQGNLHSGHALSNGHPVNARAQGPRGSSGSKENMVPVALNISGSKRSTSALISTSAADTTNNSRSSGSGSNDTKRLRSSSSASPSAVIVPVPAAVQPSTPTPSSSLRHAGQLSLSIASTVGDAQDAGSSVKAVRQIVVPASPARKAFDLLGRTQSNAVIVDLLKFCQQRLPMDSITSTQGLFKFLLHAAHQVSRLQGNRAELELQQAVREEFFPAPSEGHVADATPAVENNDFLQHRPPFQVSQKDCGIIIRQLLHTIDHNSYALLNAALTNNAHAPAAGADNDAAAPHDPIDTAKEVEEEEKTDAEERITDESMAEAMMEVFVDAYYATDDDEDNEEQQGIGSIDEENYNDNVDEW